MRRKYRPVYYVCSAMNYGIDASIIEAKTQEIATAIFHRDFGICPETVLGAFYKKQYRKDKTEKPPKPSKPPKLKKIKQLKQRGIRLNSSTTNHGTYEGWDITYISLINNPDKAYVFFNKRIDNVKMPKPRINTVNIKDIVPKIM